jgi:flagellum-specific ATP synthase
VSAPAAGATAAGVPAAAELADRLRRRTDTAARVAPPLVEGTVTAVLGLAVEVSGLRAAVGEALLLDTPAGPREAEVVAADAAALRCLPASGTQGLTVGSRARRLGSGALVPVGWSLLGRVLDADGRPLDGGPALTAPRVAVDNTAPHPLSRARVDRPMPLGVRVLDAFTTVGRGQRLGIFAGSGVGKSTLLSMITRGSEAQATVIALVGERGREVREFLEDDLGPEGLARSVVVVATSDQAPLMRLRAAFTATRIAESLADDGADVLLMLDSLTRVAMAQREVGLSAGEPPATRGYPPSTFALLPRLLERAGPRPTGSITGVYTVLVEGDDHNEPITDAARSILDGHVVLDRRIATSGRFPAVDVLESISRVAARVTTPAQRDAIGVLRRVLAAHRDARDLLDVGAYVPGSNPDVDCAVRLLPRLEDLMRQGVDEVTAFDATWAEVEALADEARRGAGNGRPASGAQR